MPSSEQCQVYKRGEQTNRYTRKHAYAGYKQKQWVNGELYRARERERMGGRGGRDV